MASGNVFTIGGVTKTIAVTSTSNGITTLEAAPNVRVINAGSNTIFVKWGRDEQTADASTDIPLLAGTSEIFYKGSSNGFAAICASGQDSTVYVTAGIGD